jgi:hypothetical protein
MGCEGVMRRGKGGLMQVEEELDVGVQTAFLIAVSRESGVGSRA